MAVARRRAQFPKQAHSHRNPGLEPKHQCHPEKPHCHTIEFHSLASVSLWNGGCGLQRQIIGCCASGLMACGWFGNAGLGSGVSSEPRRKAGDGPFGPPSPLVRCQSAAEWAGSRHSSDARMQHAGFKFCLGRDDAEDFCHARIGPGGGSCAAFATSRHSHKTLVSMICGTTTLTRRTCSQLAECKLAIALHDVKFWGMMSALTLRCSAQFDPCCPCSTLALLRKEVALLAFAVWVWGIVA